ncbi:hypothetical protein D3C87_2110600 [compost metagenome]
MTNALRCRSGMGFGEAKGILLPANGADSIDFIGKALPVTGKSVRLLIASLRFMGRLMSY